ncbi:MAG: Rrf2 family transcriptional regulator [Alphaproteobacteria bacterium]|jgi:Rrf2 family protein|nr:Rrf2 family transcriptional regulator [Alphaproteobacteria bacterium]MDP6516409.1 Rrf2 family transcriptional regulator [Alphaproteobacteria bacterium]|tara:strand:- start:506 stop:955 length:450 start_codon:yes stop_codon:yes gene_type:complete
MRLQKSSLYGLYAVLELAACPERRLSTAEIAETYGISTHHLAKVMRTLVRAGLVLSVLGPGGGYRFAGNAARVTLMDVIRLFEPMGSEIEPFDDETAAATGVGQALRGVRDEIDELAQATLSSITLKSLLKIARRQAQSVTGATAANPA